MVVGFSLMTFLAVKHVELVLANVGQTSSDTATVQGWLVGVWEASPNFQNWIYPRLHLFPVSTQPLRGSGLQLRWLGLPPGALVVVAAVITGAQKGMHVQIKCLHKGFDLQWLRILLEDYVALYLSFCLLLTRPLSLSLSLSL